ncbi:DUF1593 domain-containing protein [Acerihabitans arboris]|uniref:DUF1593 domain-containing protein n=1 Tax=Acerihabitans arboris TaxID=2691583 RepID=A0A845SFI2_9GAMM|nr:DUF1593 domain-containing protein [Acerihabitans arboris]NDL62107.1 DUF1593 domain-containing protein [Acerihabitans arboris]
MFVMRKWVKLSMPTLCLLVISWFPAMTSAKDVITPAAVDRPAEKTRIMVLTDIGNEPDDSQSLIRFLLYSNEFDTEGIIATTSTWLRDKVNPAMINEKLDAYEKVYSNLEKQAPGYPSPKALRAVVRSGRVGYGMAYVGKNNSTEASKLIISAVDKQDPRPLWINLWGGGVDLAQALYDVKTQRNPKELAKFINNIRVYSISDQDDTGVWIRSEFPTLRWITSIHAWNDYFLSTWIGISSKLAIGGDMSRVNNDWITQNIKNKGPLGALYPLIKYTMEGDTPAFLYLIRNGLSDPEHPEYGGWGGRYAGITPNTTQGIRVSTSDEVVGVDGQKYRTAAATIWRWRDAFQNDFAARIGWSTSSDFVGANHNPTLVLNGKSGTGIVHLNAKTGDTVKLSAEGSADADGNQITYRWWQYKEPTATSTGVHSAPALELASATGMATEFVAPAVGQATPFHIILAATDNGSPALTSYRRAIVMVEPSSPL